LDALLAEKSIDAFLSVQAPKPTLTTGQKPISPVQKPTLTIVQDSTLENPTFGKSTLENPTLGKSTLKNPILGKSTLDNSTTEKPTPKSIVEKATPTPLAPTLKLNDELWESKTQLKVQQVLNDDLRKQLYELRTKDEDQTKEIEMWQGQFNLQQTNEKKLKKTHLKHTNSLADNYDRLIKRIESEVENNTTNLLKIQSLIHDFTDVKPPKSDPALVLVPKRKAKDEIKPATKKIKTEKFWKLELSIEDDISTDKRNKMFQNAHEEIDKLPAKRLYCEEALSDQKLRTFVQCKRFG